MRAFNVRSLLTSEPDMHELAIASSPCLHSIWFSYMIQEEDAYASRSQRVIQQVIADLAPNVEDPERLPHHYRTRKNFRRESTTTLGAYYQVQMLPQTDKLMPDEAAHMLKEMKDQCPLLTDLAITIVKDQGSRAEVAVYKALTAFPCLRNLTIGFRTRYYLLEREQGRMPPYDRFDSKRSGRYGDMRRTFIDSAIDEGFANAVFHLVSPPDRLRRLDELRLLSEPRYPDPPKMQIYDVFKWICRSWSVKLGVRDDRPNEMFDDWYGFLDLDDADVEMIRKSGWKIGSE
ncbi:hypothetical protein KCU62_g8154, partial [Aureobasidium sp. EXF-3399]